MEFLYCGTAAAEGWPALFCECEACQKARELGGKDLRSRAAYMVGEKVRIDFGPDSLHHQLVYRLRFDRLEHLLVSHAHDDHWRPSDVAYRRPGFSRVPEGRLLHLWGNAKVRQRFVDAEGDDWDRYRLRFHDLELWQTFDLGDGLSATAIAAAHDPGEQCVNFLLHHNGGTALIANDTGWYEDQTWDFLSGQRLTMVSIDCTYGPQDNSRGHLGCSAAVRLRDELSKRGALIPGAQVLATHFSHNGGWLHEDLERFLVPQGIAVAYDGLRLEW